MLQDSWTANSGTTREQPRRRPEGSRSNRLRISEDDCAAGEDWELEVSKYNFDEIKHRFMAWYEADARRRWGAFQRPSSSASIFEYLACSLYRQMPKNRPNADGYDVEYGNSRFLYMRHHEDCAYFRHPDELAEYCRCECDDISITEAYVRVKVPGYKPVFIVYSDNGLEICVELPKTYYQRATLDRVMGDLKILATYPYENPRLFVVLEQLLNCLGWPVSLGEDASPP